MSEGMVTMVASVPDEGEQSAENKEEPILDAASYSYSSGDAVETSMGSTTAKQPRMKNIIATPETSVATDELPSRANVVVVVASESQVTAVERKMKDNSICDEKKGEIQQKRDVMQQPAPDALSVTSLEQQEHPLANVVKRGSSPFWSSEEESSTEAKQDGGSRSVSSDGTEELAAAAQMALGKRQAATPSVTVTKTTKGNTSVSKGVSPQKRISAPLGGELTEDDPDAYESTDNFRDLPDIFFPKPGDTQCTSLSMADIEICQRLDLEYERALEEREIGYNARYQSVRQSAGFSLFFMLLYLAAGTAFFTQEAGWEIHDALFFSIYTMTTVGYGLNDNIPDQGRFQVFVIFYIFIGVATLTIMVAQVYQCVALEASRAQHARDRAEISRKGKDVISRREAGMSIVDEMNMDLEQQTRQDQFMDGIVRRYEKTKTFFRDSELGRGISVLFPFAGLIIIGAVVVGPIEGWSVVESIYFSCVSLTTVGYGLYVPQHPIAIYFCIFWLPFSVGFMSLFLGNVASFYIRLSDRNIHRLERQMRRRMKRAKDKAERLQHASNVARMGSVARLGTDDPLNENGSNLNPASKGNKGFEMLGDEDDSEDPALFGTEDADIGDARRNQILSDSNYSLISDSVSSRPDGRTMQTMRDIIRTVRYNLNTNATLSEEEFSDEDLPLTSTNRSLRSQDNAFMSIRSTSTIISPSLRRKQSVQQRPTFALRVLVQERFAEIIATDIAGFQSHIEIKENTLSVTIDTLKETADKWLVPRRARKAFRAVAFEALYFVGEHGLITRGADALYDLSPFEFHGLFSPLLAAMGDAETMEGWLAHTDILADVDLRREGSRSGLHFISDPDAAHQMTEEDIQERFSNSKLTELVGDMKPRTTIGAAFAQKK